MLNKFWAKLWLMSVSKKKDVDFFWSSESVSLPHLLGDQIIAILKIIDNELITSFGFGLKITRIHVLKEKIVILKILNSFGGIMAMKKQLSFEEASSVVLESAYKMLENENRFYFEKFKNEGGTKTRYNCHLQAVISSVLLSIYNADGRIPFVGSQK